jgi:hypothetical protein
MTCAVQPFSQAPRTPNSLLMGWGAGRYCLPLLLVACGGPSGDLAGDPLCSAQASMNVAGASPVDQWPEGPPNSDDEADILAAMERPVNRTIGRRPGDPVGSDEEEVEPVGSVRADLTALLDRYLTDRVRFGSPLAWHGHLPRIACDLGSYHLVEVELTSPFSNGAATDRVWGVLIAPRVGRGYDPNHADRWFARRLSGASGRSTFTTLFHTPVLPRLP